MTVSTNNKSFAGIGAQKTPNTAEMPIGKIMGEVARILVLERGYEMTSGLALGADTFFEAGLQAPGRNAMEEGLFKGFLPKRPFNGRTDGIFIENEESNIRARQILIENKVYNHKPGSKIPRFITLEGAEALKLSERELMIRNFHTRSVYQILREYLNNPVRMVICWTPDGATTLDEYTMGVTGGTGIAIALADALGVPVFNLNRQDHLDRICAFIGIDSPRLTRPLANPDQPELF